MVVTLSETVKKSIEQSMGIPYKDLILLDADKQVEKIEEKTGKKLRFAPIKDDRLLLLMRGSIYLMMNRFFHFNPQIMDKKLNAIVKRNEKMIK